MSRKQPPEEIAAAATAASPFAGVDISKIMSSTGPVVKCVLLCATSTNAATAYVGADADLASKSIDDDDVKNAANASLHQDLIAEINVDTTPRKSQVNSILGGPFTFLGQYEDEGIVVMIRRPPPDFVDGDGGNDRDDENLSINPHRLQPPFHNTVVRGDILLMKVAPVAEEVAEESLNEDDDGAMAAASKETQSLRINKNDGEEFFLDYTKDDYLKFAARTDIIALDDDEDEDDESDAVDSSSDDNVVENDEEEDDEEEQIGDENNCDSDDEEDFDPEDSDVDDSDEEDDEEYQVGMMNMILNHMLRKFREENGRGPDSIELLEMRKALADKMGVANVAGPPQSQRSSSSDDSVDVDNDKTSSKEDHHEGKDVRKRKMKVVVAEEMNETIELMPHGKSTSCASNEEEDQDVREGENPSSEDNNEVAQGRHSGSIKRARTT
jgi:hypothetical protein